MRIRAKAPLRQNNTVCKQIGIKVPQKSLSVKTVNASRLRNHHNSETRCESHSSERRPPLKDRLGVPSWRRLLPAPEGVITGAPAARSSQATRRTVHQRYWSPPCAPVPPTPTVRRSRVCSVAVPHSGRMPIALSVRLWRHTRNRRSPSRARGRARHQDPAANHRSARRPQRRDAAGPPRIRRHGIVSPRPTW